MYCISDNRLFHHTGIVIIVMAMSTISACSIPISSQAICDGTSAIRTEHAAALAADGGDKSVVTGARLIAMIDGACR